MRTDRWFQVLVVEGALLVGGCAVDPGESGDPDDRVEADADLQDSADPACQPDVCDNTDDWAACEANGVGCCWAVDICCDYCCGHL